MKKSICSKFLFLLLTCGLFIAFSQLVYAANPQKVNLKANVTYTKYDITGDGKADKIKFTKYKKDAYDTYGVKIVVNGKTVYCNKTERSLEGPMAELLTLKNGKPFLHVYMVIENDDTSLDSIFYYKNGKLAEALNLHKLMSGYGSHLYSDIKVNGNSFKITQQIYSYTVGASKTTLTYAFSGSKLKRASNTSDLFIMKLNPQNYADQKYIKGNSLTSNTTVKVYSSVSANKVSFTIPKGKKVIVDKVYNNGSIMRYHVKYGTKTGWIQARKSYKTPLLFKNLFFAG